MRKKQLVISRRQRNVLLWMIEEKGILSINACAGFPRCLVGEHAVDLSVARGLARRGWIGFLHEEKVNPGWRNFYALTPLGEEVLQEALSRTLRRMKNNIQFPWGPTV